MKIANRWHGRASSRRQVGLLGFASSGRRLPGNVRTSRLRGKRRGPVGLPGMSRGRGNYVGPSPLPVLAYTSDEGPSFGDVQADPLTRRRRECIARMTAACSALREHRRAPRYVQPPAHSPTCRGRFGLVSPTLARSFYAFAVDGLLGGARMTCKSCRRSRLVVTSTCSRREIRGRFDKVGLDAKELSHANDTLELLHCSPPSV